MTLDDIRSQFSRKEPRLVDIVIEAANWVKPFGFVPTSSPARNGSPGDTVKFVAKAGGPMLFSLQFHNISGPFLYFKWTKKTAQRLGMAAELRRCLFEQIRPLISGRGEKEDVPTEWRLCLEPADKAEFPGITRMLTPLVKQAVEATARG